jgi:hypothetical protein
MLLVKTVFGMADGKGNKHCLCRLTPLSRAHEPWRSSTFIIAAGLLHRLRHFAMTAFLMCDRIFIFGSNPGRILNEIKVELPHPRARLDPAFRDLVECIYVEMTTRAASVPAVDHSHVPTWECIPGRFSAPLCCPILNQ